MASYRLTRNESGKRVLTRNRLTHVLTRQPKISTTPILFHYPGNGLIANDRVGTVSGTATGPVRYQPFNGARLNLIPNPSFETNTSFWNAQGITLTRSTENIKYGSFAAKAVITTSPLGLYTPTSGSAGMVRVPQLGTWTLSCWFYNAAASTRTVRLTIYERSLNGVNGVNTQVDHQVAPGSWQRLSATRAFVTTPSCYCLIYTLDTGVASPWVTGDTYYVDGVQFEQSASPTNYFDGSIQGLWFDPITGLTGTAHASASVSHAVPWTEENTTNLLRNPSAENATITTNISAAAAGTTLTKDIDYAYVGLASAKLIGDGTVASQGVTFATASSLNYTGSVRTFIGSVYLRGSGNVNVWVRVNYTDASSDTTANTPYTLNNAWARVVTASIAINSAKTVNTIEVGIRSQTATPVTIYADAAQLEEKAYATSYGDGSIGTGYTWSGTAHNSESTRASGTLSFNPTTHILATQGSIVQWVKFPIAPNGVHAPFSFRHTTAGSNRIYLSRTSGRNVNCGLGNSSTLITDGATVADDTWVCLALTWNGTTASFYKNGVQVGVATAYSGLTQIDPSTFGPAGDYAGISPNSGSITGPTLIVDRVLTSAEITAYANNPSTYSINKPDAQATVLTRNRIKHCVTRTPKVDTTPALLHVSGNSLTGTDRVGNVTITPTNPLRYQPANGALVNLITNPSFETGLTGWTGGAGTFIQSANAAYYGAFGARHTINSLGSTPFVVVTTSKVKSATTYTVSIKLRTQQSARRVAWQFRSFDATGSGSIGATIIAPFIVPSQNQWTTCTATYTTEVGAERLQVLLRFELATAQLGDVWDVDGCILLQGNIATPQYFDGSYPGAAWADPLTGIPGTAHNSTSFSQSAFWVEESTVNLLLNPSAEVNAATGVTALTGGGGSVTITRDLTTSMHGVSSFKVVTGGVAVNEGISLLTANAMGTTTTRTFIASASIRGIGASVGQVVAVFARIFYTDATSDVGTQTMHTLTDAWARVVPASITTNPAKTLDRIELFIRTNAAIVLTWNVDAAQIEEKAYATSYCDGSIGTGYSWNGSANASASTRTQSAITLPQTSHINSLKGSVLFWARTAADPNINVYGFAAGTDGGVGKDMIYVGLDSTNKPRALFRTDTGATTTVLDSGVTVNVGEWRLYYAEWDGTAVKFQLDNRTPIVTTRLTPTGDISNANGIAIGSTNVPSLFFDGYISPVLVFDRPLTASEIAAYFNNSSTYSINTALPATQMRLIRT